MKEITTFTPEELRVLSMKPSDVVREKIAATGNQEALDAFDGFVAATTGMHDVFITWITYAMSAAYEGGGPATMNEYMKELWRPIAASTIEAAKGKSFKERVLLSLSGFRDTHDAEIEWLGEDEEKIQFRMKPCGSGERLMEMGVYEPCGKCSMCKADMELTGGVDEFPVYCTHSPTFNVICNELGEYPTHVWDYPEKVGTEGCVISVYKDPSHTPDIYFERFGLKRPQK